MKILLLDNYDSFTWNLAQYLEELGAEPRVELNDAIDPAELDPAKFDALVVSPGPGRPDDAGVTVELIAATAGKLPLLGVCLGHQAIARAFGGQLAPAPTLVHGKTSQILHDGRGIFSGLPSGFSATRYHSWVVDPATLDAGFRTTAWTEDGVLMGIEHRRMPLYGVQFHPESIMTPQGKPLLANFLSLARRFQDRAA